MAWRSSPRPRGLLTLTDCLLTQAEEGDAHSLAAVTGRPGGGLVVSARGRTGVASCFAPPTGCLADIRTTDVGDSCGRAVPRGPGSGARQDGEQVLVPDEDGVLAVA